MLPVAFRAGPVDVYTYPLVLIAALAASWLVVRAFAPRLLVPRWAAADLVAAAALGALIGGRAWHVASFPAAYSAGWWRLFELQNGGLVFYGAVLGGAVTVAAVARVERLSLPAVADLAALALPLGSAIGRWGCLAAGCCGGPGLYVGDVRVPPQVIDSAGEIVLFGVLIALARRLTLGRGALFAWWLALYPVLRFGIEYLRADPRVAFGLTQAQLVSIPVAVIGFAAVFAGMREGGGR
ncbi:MAG TPA: prolipoprotein diacylglyceryl transferase family protein [Coriobacteriia bacterium]|jgi:phosphatidylglycerol:prolipoprotein diacylglycerol transferase